MGLLSVVLLSVAATADSFTIGFNYGIKQVHISGISNLFISLLCLWGTFGAMLLGRALGSAVPAGVADIVGSLALLGFGGYMLLQALRPRRDGHYADNPGKMDKDGSNTIELKESVLVGVLLSLNNMGLGIGAGIAGVSMWLTPPVCAAVSFVFIKAGCALGGRITGEKLSRLLEVISAALVLVLGVIGMLN